MKRKGVLIVQKIVNILSTDPGGMKQMVFNNAEVKAVKVRLEAGERADDCVVDAPVVLFVIEGDGSLMIENERFPLTEGDITVIPSGTNRYLEGGSKTLHALAIQSHQADKTCGLCALLQDCVNMKG
jgi:quercetin dioxygenase-like cupin family protein